MKPAPATSARSSSGLSGNAATMALASSRGLRRAAFARRSATLLAKSPCWASRVRSTTTASAAGICGSTLPTSRVREASSSCSSSCFKGCRESALERGLRVYRKSEQLYRVHIQRPAHGARSLELLDLRQPLIEKSVQRPPLAALDEQLRVIAPDALVHGRRHRSEQPHAEGRMARNGARLCEECQRGLAGARRIAQRREAAERRARRLGALCERHAGESLVTSRERMGGERVMRELPLDQPLAGTAAAPGTPGHLHDGLRQALGS